MVLQSFQNVSEHRLEHETIQFEEHSSIEKELKIEPNPTQAKHCHTTGPNPSKTLSYNWMVENQKFQNWPDGAPIA